MTIQELRDKGLILFETLSGSHSYGLATDKSDEDFRGVFIAPIEDFLIGEYPYQVSDEMNNNVYWEIGRFIELLQKNNPGMLELLFTDSEFHRIKHPLFDLILEQKNNFPSKICKNSIASYAKQQITKASGLQKKQNWEKQKIERKTVLDFCFVPYKQGVRSIKEHFKYVNTSNENYGLVNLPNMKYTYAVYYSPIPGFYKGIVSNEETANDISLSSVNKDEEPVFIMQFNKDSYQIHCREYKEYQEWLEKRNVNRWVENKEHGQLLDSKNLMHCVRLTKMAKEISEGKGLIVKRPDREYLLEIKSGKHDLKGIIKWSENELEEIYKSFDKSNLPDEVDKKMCHDLLLKIRKEFYGI